MKQIIGRKIGLIKVFGESGKEYPATVIEVLPNVVTQIKTKEKDGYTAYVVGYGTKKEKDSNKCELGIAKKINCKNEDGSLYVSNFLKEISGDELEKLNLSVKSKIDVSIFNPGEFVDVIGVSKGKGFTGSIKRFHYHLGSKSHGSGYHRGIGSLVINGRDANRVIANKKMPGHSGFHQVTNMNLLVLEVNKENNFMLVYGSIAGSVLSLVKIRSAVKKIGLKKKVDKFIHFDNNIDIKKQSCDGNKDNKLADTLNIEKTIQEQSNKEQVIAQNSNNDRLLQSSTSVEHK